ncbi:MAG: hypothetical protein WC438_04310 [Candidatus Pacearchaeota archaeon]
MKRGWELLGVIILFSISLIFAAHTVQTNLDATSFTANESIVFIYNVSVNNTDTLITANISQVNITFPSQFIFINLTNGTNAPVTFTNTSSVLTWSNDTGAVMNITRKYFWFTLNSSLPGNYNLTITTTNVSGTFNTNISIRINDTGVPNTVEFASPTNVTRSNLSQTYIDYNISAPATMAAFSRIAINLYNSTNDVANSSVNSSTTATGRFTGLADGIYYLNATINNTHADKNTSITRIITIDTTAPTLTHACTPGTLNEGDVLTCTCTGTDATNISIGPTYVVNPDTVTAGTYTTICNATDHAGNTASSSISYEVVSSSGANTGSSGGTTYSKTILENTKEFSEIKTLTQELQSKERVKLKINGQNHYVGIASLSTTSATIEITSTPIKEAFNIGEEKKFDLNDDGYYDIYVKLNSITAGKASVTMNSIYEKVTTETSSTSTEPSDSDGLNAESGSMAWIWIVIGLVVLIAAGAGYKYKDKLGF